jgi:hypothetical protein
MRRRGYGLLVIAALSACSGDTARRDGAATGDVQRTADTAKPSDGNRSRDAVQPSDSSRRQDTTPADRSGSEGPAVPCQTGGTACSAGLTCQCCGSIGPKAICLCSKPCSADGDCQGTGLPSCNKPGPSASGICTPVGYNCCWMCQ